MRLRRFRKPNLLGQPGGQVDHRANLARQTAGRKVLQGLEFAEQRLQGRTVHDEDPVKGLLRTHHRGGQGGLCRPVASGYGAWAADPAGPAA